MKKHGKTKLASQQQLHKQIEEKLSAQQTSLDLCSSDVSPQNAHCLHSLDLTKLEILNLTANPLQDKGFKKICKINAPNLKSLHLNKCFITDKGICYLSKAIFPKLQVLELGANYLRLHEESLLKCNFKNIKHLQLAYIDEMKVRLNFIIIRELMQADWSRLQLLILNKKFIKYYKIAKCEQLLYSRFPGLVIKFTIDLEDIF